MAVKRQQPKRIVFDFGGQITISPPIWPDHKLDVQPGDLTKFTPQGNGTYGYQNWLTGNLFKAAPSQEESGGVIYFGNNIARDDLIALLRILDIKGEWSDYAAFIAESEIPGKDGYLVQMRIVTKFALRFMFGAISEAEYDRFPKQQLTISEALYLFIKKECERWGTVFWEDEKNGLRGLFGGDGNYAREELAFGFTVENSYHGVYRIWSRAWLVTK